MKDLVIQVKSLKGINVNYIKTKNHHNDGFKLRHRTKFKELIYGGIFTYYNVEMDFSNSTILIDNR